MGLADASSRRSAVQGHDRHNVQSPDPGMGTSMLAQVDGADRDSSQRQDSPPDLGQAASHRQDGSVVIRIAVRVKEGYTRIGDCPL